MLYSLAFSEYIAFIMLLRSDHAKETWYGWWYRSSIYMYLKARFPKKPWSEQFSKFIKCAITTKWRNISYDDFYARVTDALETLANWRKLVFHFHSRRAIADKVIDCFRPDYFWSGQIDLCYYWSHCESHRKVDRRRIIGNADSFTLCSAQNYDHLAVWQVNFITRANRQNTESFV